MQVGVHSASANGIVHMLLQQRLIADLLPYTGIRREVKYGEVSLQCILTVLQLQFLGLDSYLGRHYHDVLTNMHVRQHSKPLSSVHFPASHSGPWMLGCQDSCIVLLPLQGRGGETAFSAAVQAKTLSCTCRGVNQGLTLCWTLWVGESCMWR